TVAGVAVGEIGGLPEDADRAGLLFPFEDALVGDVTAQEIASVPKPHWALGPTQAGGEALDGRQFQPVFLKARINRVNCRFGTTCVGMKAEGMRRCIGLWLFLFLRLLAS